MPKTQDEVTRGFECYYEVPVTKKTRDGVERSTFRIYDAEDPRWDGALQEAPYKGNPQGYLNVAHVSRLDGEEIVNLTRGVKGACMHMNKARGFMRRFAQLKLDGSERPWDQYTQNRDMIAEAKEARETGDKAALEELRDLFGKLTQPTQGAAT